MKSERIKVSPLSSFVGQMYEYEYMYVKMLKWDAHVYCFLQNPNFARNILDLDFPSRIHTLLQISFLPLLLRFRLLPTTNQSTSSLDFGCCEGLG